MSVSLPDTDVARRFEFYLVLLAAIVRVGPGVSVICPGVVAASAVFTRVLLPKPTRNLSLI